MAVDEVARSEPTFEFGRNWRSFHGVLTDRRVDDSERALAAMLDGDIAGKTFLDAGSGSGLSSLAALRLGSAHVHSFDVDPASVSCTLDLKRRHFPGDERWTIECGNAADAAYCATLGEYDIVYSWGVLHHTGSMWAALGNLTARVRPGGRLFVALYNDQGSRSDLWRRVKRIYNDLPPFARTPYAVLVSLPVELQNVARAVLTGDPSSYLRAWREPTARGMSRWHDLVDWVGGYPFEVARPEEVLGFMRARGFELVKLRTVGGAAGCNEYVFSS